MADNLVGYSRAGDDFHYRWAARRCLRMLFPNSKLTSMVVEGSKEVNAAGEYVIDVTEYAIDQGRESIDYYQLKHTTVRKDKPVQLSDLQDTVSGFSARFLDHDSKSETGSKNISFVLVTNRPLESKFIKNLRAIAQGTVVEKRFLSTIKKYTGLDDGKLQTFCSLIRIEDGHGDYQQQKAELRIELSRILLDVNPNIQVENITAMVKDRALPNSKGKIFREDILQRLGISSERELYPAEAVWETLDKTIKRTQHEELIREIHSSATSVIIYAQGGVGKSVFTRQFIDSVPEGSVGIGYDCFGAGKYRNPSETRHRHREAMVQISNELATLGLCEPLIVTSSASADRELTRMFLYRLEEAVKKLRQAYPEAILTILIDAADNAEMAAKEFNQSCFAHELLRETMPEGCKLVYLCRPERIGLLQPQSYITKLELKPFSQGESLAHLRNHYSKATQVEGVEFHRLTTGNPRVQSNALDTKSASVSALLAGLGPKPTSVEDQIQVQLETAVARLKDLLPVEYQVDIEAICTGLASLSPNIPIDVLAQASGVPQESVKSFVADIGRPLWLTDSSVQFRDEPTETWFRNKYCGNPSDFEQYIIKLEPLAEQSAYISEILPQLYLQAGQYEKLIRLALSDELLPHENPIDARNVKVYRLQFAFKAALKANKISDSVKLAMRAGEEVAGDERQIGLLRQNIDLLGELQSKEKIQHIAFRRLLSGAWMGSENIYSASLLSNFYEYQGEARGYLRSSLNWLTIYFEAAKKRNDYDREDRLEDGDILEIAITKLNLDGVNACADFLNGLKPKESVFRIVSDLARNLVAKGSFEILSQLLLLWKKEPYFIVAITNELHCAGHVPEAEMIADCLAELTKPKTRIKLPDHIGQPIKVAVIAFLECCVYRILPPAQILVALNHYYPIRATRMVMDDHFSNTRTAFMRVLALRCILEGNRLVDIDSILPEELIKEKSDHTTSQKKTDFTHIIEGLLPWYLCRMDIFSSAGQMGVAGLDDVAAMSQKARSGRYKGHDTLPQEIVQVQLEILIFSSKITMEQSRQFFEKYIYRSQSLKISDWLKAVNAAYRLPHLKAHSSDIEHFTYGLIKDFTDQGPEELAEKYISLARAVMIHSKADASAYFDDAIGIVSKFGDELGYRWEAVAALAERTCEQPNEPLDGLAYRFIRIAEVVGEQKREKHWDRSEAVQIAVRLSTNAGLSALSRWRDRDIGRFEWMHIHMLLELMRAEPSAALRTWALVPFVNLEQLEALVEHCLAIETVSHADRQLILADTVSQFSKQNVSEHYWRELARYAKENGLSNILLEQVIKSLPSIAAKEHEEISLSDFSAELPWAKFFKDVDLMTPGGLAKAKARFDAYEKKNKKHFGRATFWEGAIGQLEGDQVLKFITAMELCDFTEYYDFQTFFEHLPKTWLISAGFKRNFPSVIKGLGRKYCEKFTSLYSFDTFLKSLPESADNALNLNLGILEGLAAGAEFASAEVFFGFVRIASSLITPAEAKSVLDYSMLRFELHIDSDFGDGNWADWLETKRGTDHGIAGYIWSALGSPFRETRWRAANAVLKMSEFNYPQIFKHLAEWLGSGEVGAFGSHQYPFYRLHAKQYLLIAFSRISLTSPEHLKEYRDLFFNFAVKQKHIIIQIAAARTARNIEAAFPGTYSEEELKEVNKIGVPIGVLHEKYNFATDSYWHVRGEVPTGIDFHFGWDFDRYWFAPLGRIFGVPENQVQDLVANVVVNDWKITDGGYQKDPRVGLWNRHSNDNGTHHSHGGFPKADNLDFYNSYHGMMVVAGMLVEQMPVVDTSDGADERWDDWIAEQFLTVPNAKWLSEYKDALPLNRPDWIRQEIQKEWIEQTTDLDFQNGVVMELDGQVWVNVKGWWTERHNSYKEGYHITSALVSTATADSLLNALDTCNDPYDFKLPSYQEEGMEVNSSSFMLQGWLYQGEVTKGLDQYDPLANEMMFPPIAIGREVTERMGIEVSGDFKTYRTAETGNVQALSETWVSEILEREEQANQSGMRLRCSLEFIQSLCEIYQSALIVKVELERSFYSRYGGSSDYSGYKPPKHKIFLITKDGKIKFAGGSTQLGATVR
ncbi:hypothetical protein [Pedobacter sp. JCM 36344]|uniref:hypothetical protein n=1 Tax=Pedobacter sp. JCM 36344 TaxID=3374280 RepID=UPI003978B00D